MRSLARVVRLIRFGDKSIVLFVLFLLWGGSKARRLRQGRNMTLGTGESSVSVSSISKG